MSFDAEAQYDELIGRAKLYHENAQWQEKLRTLQEALDLCKPSLPHAQQRKQRVLMEMGGIRRRFGQYEKCVETLEEAEKAYPNADNITKSEIKGELGVAYRHQNHFEEARKAFHSQYELARDLEWKAKAEMCRAVGNEGMCHLNLFAQDQSNLQLLETAFWMLQERIDRARTLQEELFHEPNGAGILNRVKTWLTIGLDRMSLCCLYARDYDKALQLTEESLRLQTGLDPTVTSFSRFFRGRALLHSGRVEESLNMWQSPPGMCSPAMALCKEPSREHVEYLRELDGAGVRFETYDEQGFSALDYAIWSGHYGDNHDADEMVTIICDSFRRKLTKEMESCVPKLSSNQIKQLVDEEVAARVRQAQLRRHYRSFLQEYARPQMRSDEANSIRKLRDVYADRLEKDMSIQGMFDALHFVTYKDFKDHGRLPKSGDGITTSYSTYAQRYCSRLDDLIVIFFSYRWIGMINEPRIEGPDDQTHTQWRRMMAAIAEYQQKNPDIRDEDLGIWLDCACVDQDQPERRERGIDSLPLAVMQCNAMISLTDETYYKRAWCVVEMTLMCELEMHYHQHRWWEHILHSRTADRINGVLERGRTSREIDVSKLQLSKEELDRPKIDFLMRQSKLLGNDNP